MGDGLVGAINRGKERWQGGRGGGCRWEEGLSEGGGVAGIEKDFVFKLF